MYYLFNVLFNVLFISVVSYKEDSLWYNGYCSSMRMALALNNLQMLICH